MTYTTFVSVLPLVIGSTFVIYFIFKGRKPVDIAVVGICAIGFTIPLVIDEIYSVIGDTEIARILIVAINIGTLIILLAYLRD
jgi:hypothetical protein